MTNKLTEIDSKFYQESNIIPLSTKTNTGLQRCGKSEWWDGGADKLIDDRWEWQHLYFISDEEIKEGDWVLRGSGSYGCRKVLRIHKDFAICTDFWDKPIETPFPLNELKKIIVTTDKELNIHWNKQDYKALPRPSNEFLRKFCELGGISKVLVEMICPVCYGDKVVNNGMFDIDCNNCHYKNHNSNLILKVAPDNTIICKSVNNSLQEKMDKFFKETPIELIISKFEELGYKFISK